MDEQEVWVRMMAAILTLGSDLTTERCAEWADEAVAEWRKRYGAKAEPAPAPFRVGDQVISDHHGAVTVVHVEEGMCVVRDSNGREWFVGDTWLAPVKP